MKADRASLEKALSEHITSLNLPSLRTAYLLSGTLVPASALLDFVVHPAYALEFLEYRLIAAVLAIWLLWISYRFNVASSRVGFLMLAAGPPILCASTIQILILRLGGYSSTYYAGLNLCMLAIGVLYTWPWHVSATICAGIILSWVLSPLLFFPTLPFDFSLFFNNLFFLVLTAAISIPSSALRYWFARREFFASIDLAARTQELAESKMEVERSNRDLSHALTELQKLDQLKNDFFANVSHEFRTPLTLVLSPLGELMRKKGRDAKEEKMLQVIQQNSERLLRLIDDLLDLARLDSKGLRLQVARLELEPLVKRVVEAFVPTAHSKGIELICEISPNFGSGDEEPSQRVFYGDSHRLEMVLTNLIGNAIKFVPGKFPTPPTRGLLNTPAQGIDRASIVGEHGKIIVKLSQIEGKAIVSVDDNGPGIPPAQIDRVFERFHQVESSERRRYGGVGIGLALAREIVHLHQGTLTVTSTEGVGTTFTMQLMPGRSHFPDYVIERRQMQLEPNAGRRAVDPSLSDLVEPGPITSELLTPLNIPLLSEEETQPILLERGRKPRVVIAEDNEDLRAFMLETLSPSLDVSLASDGQEAFELIRREQPDVVVSDIMMPNVSGLDLVRMLKADSRLKTIPVILLTARSGTEAAVEGYGSGADDFVAKPFSARVLIARVRAHLKLRALTLQLAAQERLAMAATLSAGISHEIKNPLNAILNSAALLEAGTLKPEDAPKLYGLIGEASHRILDIISALEDQARPTDTEQVAAVDVRQGIEGTLKLLQHRMHKITVHRDFRTDRVIVAPHRELNQVFLNIIDNAIRMAPTNLWVRTFEDKGILCIQVSDDGPGIPREIQSRIFDPFFTTRDVGKGTGLGLYLCKRIIDHAGGNLRVGDRPGGGATFTIEMPVDAYKANHPTTPEAA